MILLSFDIEEFDMPFEYGLSLSWEEQIRISSEGCRKILNCLSRHEVKATFFCTARFAENAPELIREISESGHEIASHGYGVEFDFHNHIQIGHNCDSSRSP